jgi:phospholipase/carboxylesterase
MATVDILKGPKLMPASGKPVKSAVVLLHGYGSNGDDLIGLAPFFASVLPDTIFYSPNAPQSIEGTFMSGFQWFSLETFDPDLMRRDPTRMAEKFKLFHQGAASSTAAVNSYIDKVLAVHSLEDRKLGLLGFSQGAMMSLHVGLRRKKQLGGILSYSGALTGADVLAAEIRSKPPVALVHGDSDPVIPHQALAEAGKALASVGIQAEMHTVRGLQHGINAEAAKFGASFLCKVIK